MKNKILVVLLTLLLAIPTAKSSPTIKQYFGIYEQQAKWLYLFFGTPPSVQLAQAYCETKFGSPESGKIGYHFNNVFSIMDFENDYWIFGSDTAKGAWGKVTYTWRVYPSRLIAWIDHAVFMWLYYPRHRFKPWQYWRDNPVKYGMKGYWKKIAKTIEEFELYKYDFKTIKK